METAKKVVNLNYECGHCGHVGIPESSHGQISCEECNMTDQLSLAMRLGDRVPKDRISSYAKGIYNKVVRTFKEHNLDRLKAEIIYQGKKNKQCVAISGGFDQKQREIVVKMLQGFTTENKPGDMAWVVSHNEVFWWV